MKAFQKIFAALFALLLCVSTGAGAFASEVGDPDWDTVSAAVLAQYNLEENQVYAGYRNLVTGEEHYINGDEYAVAASMFKVPLCMYATEQLNNGSIDWSVYEQYFSFQSVMNDILIDSSNEQAYFLCDTFLGGYNQFRVDGIIETMQKAMTDRFFKLNEPRFRIAHKPGWISEDLILNDCAICYTTQPIAIVVFSRGGSTSEEFLSAWCTAMCEYTEKLANKPSPTPEPTPEPAPATPVPVATPVPTPAAATAPDRVQLPWQVPAAAVGAFLLVGLIIIIVLCVKYRARFTGLFLALILSAAGMLLASAGIYNGTLYARPSGDPAASVERFLGAICSGDYPAAYTELRDYSDLGLAETPASPAGQRVQQALHESFSYSLAGECRTDRLEAVQPVRFTYLDLARLEEAVAEETQHQAEAIVQNRSVSEVYDENRRYRPEVANEAYLAALNVVLQNAAAYYAETQFDLSLAYTDGRWQILASPALLRALAGGIGY